MAPIEVSLVKRLLLAGLVVAIVAAFAYALSPRPVPVDVAKVERGTLRVTVDEEGRTRIRDIYAVSTPITGRLQRSTLSAGDFVKKDETIVAMIEPASPPFLDLRGRRELDALIKAAEATVALTEAELRQAEAELTFAETELTRSKVLAARNVVSERNLQRAEIEAATRKAAVARAQSAIELRRRELESAKARRTDPNDPELAVHGGQCCVKLLAPANGRVLKVLKESEQVVLQGTPIVEIGDPADLEVVVELLSTDAARIEPNASAMVDGWGGAPMRARVDRVNPAGFKKISALGIEEQRVEVFLSLEGAPEVRARLGHDFHVFARIDVLTRDNALLVPIGALFRTREKWTVYRVEGGKVRITEIEIGARNSYHAEVVRGLDAGAKIVLHPSDRVSHGVRVMQRSAS